MVPPLTRAEDEYAKNPLIKREDVQKIKKWIDTQPHLPPLTDIKIIQFLHSTNFDAEKAKETIEKCMVLRAHMNEILDHRTIQVLYLTLSYILLARLPDSPDGYNVLYCRFTNINSEDYNFCDCLATFDMLAPLYLTQHETKGGFIMVLDAADVKLTFFFKISLSLSEKYAKYLQEGAPVFLKRIHVINSNFVVNKILHFVKRFLEQEVYDKIFLHTDLESFYEYYPKENLPKELGGNFGTLKSLHQNVLENIRAYEDVIMADNSLIADLSKEDASTS